MFGLLRRDTMGIAQVTFAGKAPPPAEAFGRLLGTTGSSWPRCPPQPTRCGRWVSATPTGRGDARLFPGPPAGSGARPVRGRTLTDAEKAAIGDATAAVVVQVPARRGHVLADRKTLLRFARALMGEDGLVAVDMAAQLPWSRAALDDELAHDADLDIEALYCLHMVTPDGAEPGAGKTPWLHTHGLAEIGTFDMDVVDGPISFIEHGGDLLRGSAFAGLAGEVKPDTARFRYGPPDRNVRFVPVGRFMREADLCVRGHARRGRSRRPPRGPVRAGGPQDPRLRARGAARAPDPGPAAVPGPFVALFTSDATALMGERARATVPVLRALREALAEFQVQALVKLGYPTTEGGHEHLWFEVHGFGEGTVDATLVTGRSRWTCARATGRTGRGAAHGLDADHPGGLGHAPQPTRGPPAPRARGRDPGGDAQAPLSGAPGQRPQSPRPPSSVPSAASISGSRSPVG